ncbi:hypothetical protein EIN_405530 [Entamoeba invadens IP1]|uniref:Uncharacterized protein n=1 Tax=Entamoeba invadens IP1 TaxID=370355 RepID=A0A0A1UCV9_ENTIV|nr:hypothetical protein EIN_405530 [Entamoeba invadens IP1]ELP90129.1 hypothetical protein EIN_405530 [Entamoeba invadens IP1]|eukprot:XP_004256900.1 hypothetical protein EIN_405530 [Entamoeba invadens IP1]
MFNVQTVIVLLLCGPVFSLENGTKHASNNKDDISRKRSVHPVLFSASKAKGFLNFCEENDGFDISRDLKRECFYKPYIESMVIPSSFIIISIVIGVITVFVTSCVYCCCNSCCHIKCVCCSTKPSKPYEKRSWLNGMIVALVIVILLIPFLVVGVVGNKGFGAALDNISHIFFDSFDYVVDVYHECYSVLNRIDLTPFKNITSFDPAVLNETLEAVGKVDNTINSVNTFVSHIHKFVDWGVSFREIIVDFTLIITVVPLFLYFFGAFFRLHFFVAVIFPFAVIFACISMSYVAVEYPAVTLVSDLCVFSINEYNKTVNTNKTELNFLDNLINIFSDCQNSELDKLFDEIQRVQKVIVKDTLEMYNQICIEGIQNSTKITRFDGENYNKCTGVLNNTLCVKKVNKTANMESFVNCPPLPGYETATISDVIKTLNNISISNFKFYFLKKTNNNFDTVRCENSVWGVANLHDFTQTNIVCDWKGNYSVKWCMNNCVDPLKSTSATIELLVDVSTILADVVYIISEKVLPMLSCDNVNSLAKQLKVNACYNLIEEEKPLIAGLIGHAIILLLLYVVTLFLIKRFDRNNYKNERITSDDGTNETEIEMEEINENSSELVAVEKSVMLSENVKKNDTEKSVEENKEDPIEL